MTPICPTGADPAEAEAFLAAHPEIEAIDLVLIDVNGVARGKIIRRHELAGLYQSGRFLPVSILGLDICGEDVHETGLIWDQGDGDRRAWPVPGSLKPLWGTNPARAEVLVSLYDLDNEPMLSDPRHALTAQTRALAEQGLFPAAAFELEFYLLDPSPGADGKPRPARLGGQEARTDVYSVDALHALQPLASDIYAATAAMDMTAETLISEYAPGQFELTLHHRADVMRAADDLARLKRIVRAQAARHGLLACFMAKPFEAGAGSGMHLHVSLPDATGQNRFSETTPGTWSPALLQAIAGMQVTLGESMAIFAPHANSWRRFARQSYAPVAPSWGLNNRSVALRIPAGLLAARRIEHRLSGVDANPYLVATTVLAALRHGLDHRLTPTAEASGNGYAPVPGLSVPTDWASAIAAARGSAFLQAALGQQLHRTFCAIKTAELDRVTRTIPDTDYALYLHRV